MLYREHRRIARECTSTERVPFHVQKKTVVVMGTLSSELDRWLAQRGLLLEREIPRHQAPPG
jgi:hypothetical protein